MSKVVLVKTATFVKTDGGVFSEFRIWSEIDFFFSEIDFDKKSCSTSPRWGSDGKGERKFCSKVSPIGNKEESNGQLGCRKFQNWHLLPSNGGNCRC